MEFSPHIGGFGPRVHFTGVARPRPKPVLRVLQSAGQVQEFQEDEALKFMAALFQRAGLEAGKYRPSALRRRLPACLRALGAGSLEEAWKHLSQESGRVSAAMDSVLLGVTDFFRDAFMYDHLEQKVLPSLTAGGQGLSVWSAACSSGQELYSVAWLLDKAGVLEQSRLLGTDCRAEAIRQAETGVFSWPSGLGVGKRKDWAGTPHGVMEVPPAIRRQLNWKRQDLLREVEEGPWDLILWRNMGIYLNYEIAAELWERLLHELRPGGYLVTGKAEQPPRHLGLSREASCIFRKPLEKGGSA